MSAITDEAHKLLAELEAEGHALADRFRAFVAKLKGDEQQLATDATADVHQVETDVAPVVAEAKADAAHLAHEAADDAKTVTAEPTPAPAAPIQPPTTAS